MSEVFYLKRGNLKYGLEYKLDIYVLGSGVLAGSTARFRAMDAKGVTLIDGAATISDDDGILQYAFASGQTEVAGYLRAEFDVIFPGTLPATFPTDGFLTVAIADRVPDI